MQKRPIKSETTAKDFLIPRNQMFCVDKSNSLYEVMDIIINKTGLKRRRAYVVNENNECIGMLGLARLTTALNDGVDPKKATVGQYMRSDFVTIPPSATVGQCRDAMGRSRMHHLVVTDSGSPQGKVVGAMTAWLVAQEQSTQTRAYPHNVLARQYQQNWAAIPPENLRITKSRL